MRGGSTDVQLFSDFTISPGIVEPQAEYSSESGPSGIWRITVHGSVHVRESVHGRKHQQKWKASWMLR